MKKVNFKAYLSLSDKHVPEVNSIIHQLMRDNQSLQEKNEETLARLESVLLENQSLRD